MESNLPEACRAVLGAIDKCPPGTEEKGSTKYEHKSRRAAACGRAELLAKKRHTDRLQNPAKLRRFWIRGGIRAG